MMKRVLSLLLALVLFAGLLTATAAAAPGGEFPYLDEKPGGFFYEGVKYVWENDLMEGVSDRIFAAGRTLTREMLTEILRRLSSKPGFNDITSDAWYKESVACTSGGAESGEISPKDPVTRERLCTMLYRCVKSPLPGGELVSKDKKKVSKWAKEPMGWALKYGLISYRAEKNDLAPKGVATRGLTAEMLRKIGTGALALPRGLDVTDAHEAVENADFSALERIYAGKRATYAGLHEHSDSGKVSRNGKMTGSDGKFPLKLWKDEVLAELGYDVAAIIDHHQVQHMYSPDWDSDLFICGSEMITKITDLSPQASQSAVHYALLFDEKDDLMNLLLHFPAYEFSGDSPDPHYWGFSYPEYSKAQFRELVDYVRELGGIVTFSHPLGSTKWMTSTNIEDYFLGEFTYFDTITWGGPYTATSENSYAYWERLLQAGHHVYASAIGDNHSTRRSDPSTVYTATKKAAETFATVRTGNFTAGFMGIKMNVGDKPMGSVAGYKEGDVLTIEVGDFLLLKKKPTVKPNSDYYLRVFTEKGLCAYKKISAAETTRFAITTKDRAYYRADIYNADCGYAIAIGNPIWQK